LIAVAAVEAQLALDAATDVAADAVAIPIPSSDKEVFLP
jgi:hypothetical protein